MNIQRTAVIGAGTMGHALALVHAMGGCNVTLYDNNPEVLQGSLGMIKSACATLHEAGSITDEEARAALDRISPTDMPARPCMTPIWSSKPWSRRPR